MKVGPSFSGPSHVSISPLLSNRVQLALRLQRRAFDLSLREFEQVLLLCGRSALLSAAPCRRTPLEMLPTRARRRSALCAEPRSPAASPLPEQMTRSSAASQRFITGRFLIDPAYFEELLLFEINN